MPLDVLVIDNSLGAINKKIYEIKKKIQLSEGQRKAQYEECIADKKKNVQKIRQLKKEVRSLHESLGQRPDRSDIISKTIAKYRRDVTILRNKSNNQAVEFADCKAFDQRKRLDLLIYNEQSLENKLKTLLKEREDFVQEASMKHMKQRDKEAEEKICYLENQIHHVEMNIMEAEHVRKKYRSIRGSLIQDGVEFESSLDKMVKSIEKQEEEIKNLNAVYKEARSLRDLTKGALIRQEENATQRGKVRERQLFECRAMVEDRKLELERLERHIFPTGRPLMHQDSDSDSEVKMMSAEEAVNTKTIETMEAAFTVLKEATGVSEYEEVLERFLSQRKTQTRLVYLKKIAEEEKSELEGRQARMTAELEAFKFAEIKDKEQNVEEIERVKKWIDDETKLKAKYLSEAERVNSQMSRIRASLSGYLSSLEHTDEAPCTEAEGVISSEEIFEALKVLKLRVKEVMVLVDEEEAAKGTDDAQYDQMEPLLVPLKTLPEDVWTFPRPDDGNVGDTSRGAPTAQPPESDDEEEVPTRSFLKRQAQFIIDAKLRRKQFTVTRRGKSAFAK